MCEFKMYKPGEKVLMKSGGIVWRGKVKNPNVEQKINELGYQLVSPNWEIEKNQYETESEDYLIIQHFPTMNGLDLTRDRILESEVSKSFKDQELAKFKANVKRAFQHRIDIF
jgi:hypothetical protein